MLPAAENRLIAVSVAPEQPGAVLIIHDLGFRGTRQIRRLEGAIGQAAHGEVFRAQGRQLQSVAAGFDRPVFLLSRQLDQFTVELLRAGSVHQLRPRGIQTADPDHGNHAVCQGIGDGRAAGQFPVRHHFAVFHGIDPLAVPQQPAIGEARLRFPEVKNRFLPGPGQLGIVQGEGGQHFIQAAVNTGFPEHRPFRIIKNQGVHRSIRRQLRSLRVNSGRSIHKKGSVLALGVLPGRIVQQLFCQHLSPDAFKQFIQFRGCDHIHVLLRCSRQDQAQQRRGQETQDPFHHDGFTPP